MRRPSKPWYRQFNDTWYITRNGAQIPLAKGKANKKDAERAFYRLMAGETPHDHRPSDQRVVAVLDLFLEYTQKHTAADTYQWYRGYLQDFADRHGTLRVEDLRPYHVTSWLDSHPTWKNSRRSAIVAIKRAFNWAADEGIISANPIKKIKKPPATRRERLLTDAEKQKVVDSATDTAFRDLLVALRETGARPGEVASVTAAMVDVKAGTWTLPEHKTKRKTQKPRVIYLNRCMLTLTRKLMAQRPDGPLFRNANGRPWNRNAIRCRFRRLRKKANLGDDLVAYLFRHAFATDALEQGVPVAAVAELLGHTDMQMISEHYGHLAEKRQHLRKMAEQATGRKP